MNFKRISTLLIVIYAVMAVVTFGHAWNAPINQQVSDESGYRVVRAYWGSIFWPLYWSAVVQEKGGES